MLHVGARYYAPAVSRWTSADKWLGDIYRPLSLNRYLYCEDDPVNYVDPSGRADFALDPKTGRMVCIFDKWQAPPILWGETDVGIGLGFGVGFRVDYKAGKGTIVVSIEIGPFTWEGEVKVPPRTWPPHQGIGSPYPPVVRPRVPGRPYELYDPSIHDKYSNLIFY